MNRLSGEAEARRTVRGQQRGRPKLAADTPLARNPAGTVQLAFGGVLVAVLISLLVFVNSALGQRGTIDREYEIKAAYLYNFGKYVEWPASGEVSARNDRSFVIGILGVDPFEDALMAVARTKQLRGQAIAVHHIRKAEEYRYCQILFVPRGTPPDLFEQVQAKLDGEATLIVGEGPGFAESGGIINFYTESNNVKFEINAAAAENRGLRISSKLLQLGRAVSSGTGP